MSSRAQVRTNGLEIMKRKGWYFCQSRLNRVVEKYRPAYDGEKRKLRDNVDFLAKSIIDRGQTEGLARRQVDGDVFTEKERCGYVYHNTVKLVKGKGLEEKE